MSWRSRILTLGLAIGLSSCNASDISGSCPDCCQSDSDCRTGTYCGAAAQCVSDCAPGGPTCAAGQVCSGRGRCEGGGTDGGGTCASIDVKLTPVVPRVVLLIDQSGSMDTAFGQANGMSLTRWQAVRYALTDATVGAVTQLQSRVRFSAVLYHSIGGTRNGGICPLLTRSAPAVMGDAAGRPALNNRAAIDALFVNNKPASDTPTAESVQALAADQALWGTDVGPQVLVIATDGEPDTCADPDASGAVPQGMSESAVQAAYKASIRSYILSVGTEVSAGHLSRMANAGAGKPLTPASEPYFQATSPAALADAFNAIIRGSRSCKLGLNGEADPAAQAQAQVALNGKPLKNGSDWTLADKRTIELLGATCQSFLAADTVDLKATFPCGSVIILQ